MKAVRISRHGGPEALSLDEVAVPAVAAGQILIRILAAGVNFLDVYHRSGLYPMPLPMTLGQEGAGTVEAVGEDVTGLAIGDRVAWAAGPGSYADYAAVPAANVVRIPDAVSTRTAAALMLQGMTAHYLAASTFPVGPGTTCLVYAAAGGVGQLLTQIAKLRGAIVIATVSSGSKAELARSVGADHVVRYDKEEVAAEVRRITEGRGVDVAFDSVGKASWQWSLDSVRARGMIVSFGNSSGPVGSIDPLVLARKGSLFLTRPTLAHYTATREELESRAQDLLTWVAEKKLRVNIDRDLPLADAAEAHRALEGRRTLGKVLLIP